MDACEGRYLIKSKRSFILPKRGDVPDRVTVSFAFLNSLFLGGIQDLEPKQCSVENKRIINELISAEIEQHTAILDKLLKGGLTHN